MDESSIKGRLISLGYDKGTKGLNSNENKEMDTLNQKLAMQRRMSNGPSMQQQSDEISKKYN